METQDAAYWIKQMGLLPHPEGGYYKETYRSDNIVTTPNSQIPKSACTSIYYLLEGDDYSGFHRIGSDELWYFHKGTPLHIHVIDEAAVHIVAELSDRVEGNFSMVVKAGLWFAAEIPSKTGFTLVSCAVAPGFEFAEFEMGEKTELLEKYPHHSGVIHLLCRS